MSSITKNTTAKLPTKYGEFLVSEYEDNDGKAHLALVKGDIQGDVLVRVHSQCTTGDILGSLRCDCGEQLQMALKMIGKEGGVLLYMAQEGRGIGLKNKIKAYALQDEGMDTVEANEKLGFKADERDYTIGCKLLSDLGVKKIRLLTNNPKKIEGLEKYGLEIVERIPLIVSASPESEKYLATKKEKLGHFFEDKGIVK
jgi:3,4-dihydroxy 2-butanone 4-phosphate synthase/GTP cyclohydrolase II|tara:strand:+ start:5861 stop:6457 length:597 start_codon:yes stop_codon:yes gene_type:complete